MTRARSSTRRTRTTGFGLCFTRLRDQAEVSHMAGKAKRTTHQSSSGTKLYAVRDAKGRFKDIQTYKRAHGSDIKRKSKAEK